jgi:hypothetical protein
MTMDDNGVRISREVREKRLLMFIPSVYIFCGDSIDFFLRKIPCDMSDNSKNCGYDQKLIPGRPRNVSETFPKRFQIVSTMVSNIR